MTIRTILVAASGGGATTGAIDLGCQLARRFDAHLEGFHVIPDSRAVFAAMGPGVGGPGSARLVETVMEEAAARATATRALFDEIVGRHGIVQGSLPLLSARQPSASWREATGDAALLVASHGRFFDLMVLGRSDRVVHEPHTDTIEETLARSGRPLVLAPASPPSGVGYVVAIAWNGSPQAVRALVAALPFLEKANAVSLITAGDTEAAGSDGAIDYLAWHGVAVEHRHLSPVRGRHLGRSLIAAAQEAGADLLVMGGYGHAPWREQLFGGATRTALATMPLPMLLVH
jgi:nucleotide-binding universal stress UspA family protein